ncbi:MAG: hypothetical protein FJX29_06305 [Alphaproteobacteria bacterium]|nr:hypothetical protein [Alphaproteobacteria bacterium]
MTLAGKLVLAGLVAIGFAVPVGAFVAIVLAVIFGAIGALIFGDSGGLPDVPSLDDCASSSARRKLMLTEIEKRRAWLKDPAAPAPARRMMLRAATKG